MHPASSPWPARETSVFQAGSHSWELGRRTLVVGILNCTPDSFSDGGSAITEEAIARRLEQIAEEGADLVDVGGESTRPGAPPVEVEEEWRRISPALRAARSEGRSLPVSVDTTKEEVARRAIQEGAVIVNDVSALSVSPGIASLAARSGAGLILMHRKGTPETMQIDPRYEDLLGEIRSHLAESVRRAESAGVAAMRILVDPGIGFGKTIAMNLALLRHVSYFRGLGAGILVGTSRKSFLGKLLGDLKVEDRLEATLASHVGAVLAGAHAIRAHDVRAAVRAARIADALRDSAPAGEGWPSARETV
jgi:dihydropteroate synthase